MDAFAGLDSRCRAANAEFGLMAFAKAAATVESAFAGLGSRTRLQRALLTVAPVERHLALGLRPPVTGDRLAGGDDFPEGRPAIVTSDKELVGAGIDQFALA